tara:strand:- start:168 stop:569 length:402 start_codon:yes stop_codon:yes gene_type:complete
MFVFFLINNFILCSNNMNKIYVLYDGQCGFCCKIKDKTSSLIDEKNIQFCSFYSKKGKKIISKLDLKDFSSLIFISHSNKVFYRGKAVFKIIKQMKKPYKFLFIFNFLPTRLIDFVYNLIAKNRYCIIKADNV